LFGCAVEAVFTESGEDVKAASSALLAAEWSLYAPSLANPGGTLKVSVSTSFAGAQDVLIEVTDPSGVIASERVSVEGGYQYKELTLNLPAAVSDVERVSVVGKVLAAGGPSTQVLDTKTLRLGWPVKSPIPAPLHYGGALDAWNVAFMSPVGNHASQTVEVRRAAATDPDRVSPFEGAYMIQSFSESYGIFKTNYGLNLATGEVYKTTFSATSSPQRTSVVVQPPTRRDELSAYTEILDALRGAVRWNATFHQGTEWPQLQDAAAYLDRASGSLYARFGEFIRAYDANYVTEYTAGERGYVGVSFGTATQRDVLVDLFVGDRWVASSRRTVGPGSGSDTLTVDVPSWVRPLSKGTVYVKLLPVGAPWTSKLSEQSFPVIFLGPEQLRWVTAPDSVSSSASFEVSGSFQARQGMDVRADLFDASGRWLTGTQAAGVLSYEYQGVGSYSFRVNLTAPSLPAGSKLTLYTKLLPTNAQWYSMVDEEMQTILVE
jgi:hypothetical protein